MLSKHLKYMRTPAGTEEVLPLKTAITQHIQKSWCIMASASGSLSHIQKGRNFRISHLLLVSAEHHEFSQVMYTVYRAVAFNGFPSQSWIRENSSSFSLRWDNGGEGNAPPLLSPHRLWTGNYHENSFESLRGNSRVSFVKLKEVRLLSPMLSGVTACY